jgi:hypothetical protein
MHLKLLVRGQIAVWTKNLYCIEIVDFALALYVFASCPMCRTFDCLVFKTYFKLMLL